MGTLTDIVLHVEVGWIHQRYGADIISKSTLVM